MRPLRSRPGARARACLLIMWGCFLLLPCFAQREPQKAEPKEIDQVAAAPGPQAHKVEIRSFSPEQDLADLLDFCAAISGIPIEFNRAEVAGSIGLRLPQAFSEETLWDLASPALAARD